MCTHPICSGCISHPYTHLSFFFDQFLVTVNVVGVLPTGGATVCWLICGKFRPVFALISTGSNVSAASISLRSDFAVASSRGGMVGEVIGFLCSLLLVWFWLFRWSSWSGNLVTIFFNITGFLTADCCGIGSSTFVCGSSPDITRPFQCNIILHHAYDLMYSIYHVACNVNNCLGLTCIELPWEDVNIRNVNTISILLALKRVTLDCIR